jgi:uncharacterized protein
MGRKKESDQCRKARRPVRSNAACFFGPGPRDREDISHSAGERRYFCFGKVDSAVLTVRFTYRHGQIRIIGAGYWRKGRKIYEQANR